LSSATTAKEQLIPVATIMALCFLGQSGLTVYLPAAQIMARTFETSPAQIQLLLTAFMLPYSAVIPFVGPLSDRIGRRPMILGGTALYAAASVLAGISPTLEVMYFARAGQGIGACCMMVLTRAMVRDMGTGPAVARALTYTGMALSLANIIAPVIGYLLLGLMGWQGTFLGEAAAAAVTLVAALRLKETASRGGIAGKLVTSYMTLFTIPPHVGNCLAFAFSSAAYFSWISASPPIFMNQLGITEQQYAFIPMLYGAGFFFTGLIATRLFSRTSDHTIIMAGNTVQLAGAVAMLFFAATGLHHPVLIAAPSIAIGIGNGLCLPRHMNVALTAAPVEIAGAASAVLMFSQYVIGTLASIIAAATQHTSVVALGLGQVAWLGLGLAAYLAVAGTTTRPAKTP
jgi:DHA1 family bicyclomycin/chloramphenicol resistance-like MFS transporter